MNKTTTDFIEQLKSKPLDQYTLQELQECMAKCGNLYLRFEKGEERIALNGVWNKMTNRYNHIMQEQFGSIYACRVYERDWLLKTIKR